MKMRSPSAAAFAVALALVLPAKVVHSQADERKNVLAVADSALAAVSRKDFIAFTDLMLDSAVTFAAGEVAGKIQTQFQTRAQQRAGGPPGVFTERGFKPDVQISGPLATVWMRYDFYTNGQWSHCGVDAFTLLKTDSGWKIATLAFSIEQPPACEKHPAGPPMR